MDINLEYLLMCRDIYHELEKTKSLLIQATRPVVTDISLIRPICELIDKEFPKNEKVSAFSRAKVFIILYLYSPAKLVSRDSSHSRVMTMLVECCGIGKDMISRYKYEAVDFYRFNSDFRKEVDDVMVLINDKFLS